MRFVANNTPDQERARIKSHVAIQRITGCWLWIGTQASGGYGMMKSGGKMVSVHRKSYQLFKGPIPHGKQLDHLCRNRPCCNPSHLEAVTCRENLLRGKTKAADLSTRTHCKRGHAFDEANTRITRTGNRACRKCGAMHTKAYALADPESHRAMLAKGRDKRNANARSYAAKRLIEHRDSINERRRELRRLRRG